MYDLEFMAWLKQSIEKNRKNGYCGYSRTVSVKGLSKADLKAVEEVISTFTVKKRPATKQTDFQPSTVKRARKTMDNPYYLYFNQVGSYRRLGSSVEDVISGAVRLDTSLTRETSPRRIFNMMKELISISTSDIEKRFNVDYESAKRLSQKCRAVVNALDYHLEKGNIKLSFNPYFEEESLIDDFDVDADAKAYLEHKAKKAA
ncbi:TPA: hypothetical protein MA429_004292 [Klebsiella pneumoniae]|nr:hypothetical protein [Klebsiella pneumoniae]